MHKIKILDREFKYIVGTFTVGIIPPSRKKHIAYIKTVRNGATGPTGIVNGGMYDSRITPHEVARYIIEQKLQ